MKTNDHKNAMVIVLSAPSGGGKSSIAARLVEMDNNIVLSISATTRPPRPGEKKGVNYFFTNRAEFERMQENDELLEAAQIYGNLYGTPRNFVTKQLDAGKDVLFDIDFQGAYQLMESLPNRVLSIFIIPPSLDVLRERLVNRKQDDQVTIEKRLNLAEIEMKEAENYDCIVINDNFEKTVEKILEIINARRNG